MLARLSEILAGTGKMLLGFRGSAAGVIGNSDGELKTRADQSAHRMLGESLGKITPGTPVLSEEDPSSLGLPRPDAYWLIDPVDGTASLLGGFDGFVTQAALIERGRIMLAGVYAPALDLMYLAERDGGATCNGKPLNIGEGYAPGSLIDNYPQPRGAAHALMQAFAIPRYVESGSLGLKICRVADGTADVFFKDVVVRDWDLAAPQLVLEEAGGVLTDRHGVAVPYQGGFERAGLIAARSGAECAKIAAWDALRHEAGA